MARKAKNTTVTEADGQKRRKETREERQKRLEAQEEARQVSSLRHEHQQTHAWKYRLIPSFLIRFYLCSNASRFCHG